MALTNLQALSASVNYPVEEIKLQKILVDNGLIDTDAYEGVTRSFELATAALYTLLVTSADISEGDYKISATEKANYMKLASSIYAKYGVADPTKSSPKISNRSFYW